MTFDEFKTDFLAFLDNSTVNLGRKGTKTRQAFLDRATKKLELFHSNKPPKAKKEKTKNPMSGSVMRIKPVDRNRGLDVGKGVHAMTASESARADEQLNRSPYSIKKNNDEKKDK